MALKPFLNSRLVLEPILGKTFIDVAVAMEDKAGIIVLNDSALNYVFCKRAKKFDGTIFVGKAHQIEYQLAQDKAENIWVKIEKAAALDIKVDKIDTSIMLKAIDVKAAFQQKTKDSVDVVAAGASTSSTPPTTHQQQPPGTGEDVNLASISTPSSSSSSKPTTVPKTIPVPSPPPPTTHQQPNANEQESQPSKARSSSESSYEPIELSGTIAAITRYEDINVKVPTSTVNFYLHNKEKNELDLVKIYRSDYEKHKDLLVEGQGVQIIDVSELPANMNSMPSTLKEYTFYYVVNNQTTIKNAPAHTIDIDVIKEHFKLWTIQDVHNSHYVRGSTPIHVAMYAKNFEVRQVYRDVPSVPGLNYIDLEVSSEQFTGAESVRGSQRRKKKARNTLALSFAGRFWREHLNEALIHTQPILFLDMSVYDRWKQPLCLTSIGSSKAIGSVKTSVQEA